MQLTQERLKEVLKYDPETGEFFWLKDGKLAGCAHSAGYKQFCVDGKNYLSHRLAWLYVYGYFPENDTDHINRVRSDNRIVNLREVSRSCNMRNMKGYSASGVKGVRKLGSKWEARIRVGDKEIYLGHFTTLFAAAKARVAAEEKYGFVTCDRLSEAKIFITENTDDGGEKLVQSSSSGVKGVSWQKRDGKWRAQRKGKYLGLFNTIEEAKAVLNL